MKAKYVARSARSMGGTTFYQQIVRAIADDCTHMVVYIGEGKYEARIAKAYYLALSDVRSITDKEFTLRIEYVSDNAYRWFKSKGY